MLHFSTPQSAAAISDGARRMARIRRLSRCMRWLLAATAVLFVVLAVAIWFLSSDAALTRSLHALLGITDPSRAPALQLGPGYRVAGFSLLGLQLALVLRGIAHAHAMFGDFARGEVLTSATARRLRGIALLITLFALCSPLVKMLLVLLFTWNAPGEPHMLIHIQLEDILLGLAACCSRWPGPWKKRRTWPKRTGVHLMAIVVRLDVVLAQRKMKARQLAQEIGITEPNLPC